MTAFWFQSTPSIVPGWSILFIKHHCAYTVFFFSFIYVLWLPFGSNDAPCMNETSIVPGWYNFECIKQYSAYTVFIFRLSTFNDSILAPNEALCINKTSIVPAWCNLCIKQHSAYKIFFFSSMTAFLSKRHLYEHDVNRSWLIYSVLHKTALCLYSFLFSSTNFIWLPFLFEWHLLNEEDTDPSWSVCSSISALHN